MQKYYLEYDYWKNGQRASESCEMLAEDASDAGKKLRRMLAEIGGTHVDVTHIEDVDD